MPENFGKSERFIIHQQTPFNGGITPEELGAESLTPVSDFYVRGHGPVPTALAPDSVTIEIGGMVKWPFTLTLADLQRDFPAVTREITLQCAGNRRTELHDIRPMQKNALLWKTEAISNAIWTGVEMGDVLRAAGIDDGAAHVEMLGGDLGAAPDGSAFGSSIPVEKALQAGTLLAWEMNGAPLMPIHGAPLRAIVPGFIAARSVKWLRRLTVQTRPSDNHFQAHDYKTFPIDITEHNVDWSAGKMLDHHATHAAMLSPAEGETVAAGRVTLKGYALAAGDAVIERVEFSLDGGQTWQTAAFDAAPRLWVWALWSAEIDLSAGQHTITVRTFDSDGYVQPQHPADIWNFRGYQNNAWHWVNIMALPAV